MSLYYDNVVEAACELDRAYFRRRPGESSYVRRVVEGEFWPSVIDPACTHVLVMKLGPEARTRQPFIPDSRAEGGERRA